MENKAAHTNPLPALSRSLNNIMNLNLKSELALR